MTILFKFVALLAALTAPAAMAADLSSIYQEALSHDSQLKAAKSGLQVMLEGEEQISAAYFPTIAINANISKNRSQTSGEAPNSYDSRGYGITLTQRLYHRDVIINSREIRSAISQSQLEYRLAQQELILRVANGYFELLSALDGLELARAEKRAVSQQLKRTQQRFDVGLSAITEVHEAQAGFDMIVVDEIDAKIRLDSSREALREIIGREVGEIVTLQANLPLSPPTPANINHWIKLALKDNISLNIQRAATATARHGIDLASADRHPSIDFIGSYDYSDKAGDEDDENRSTHIGLNLEMLLYSGGYIRSKERESAHLYQQEKFLLEQQRRATEHNARSAYLGVTASISQVNAYRQALASNQIAYEATQTGYDEGTHTTLDLLNAHRDQFRSKRDYASARYGHLLALFRLKEVAGALAEADLKQVNNYLAH